MDKPYLLNAKAKGLKKKRLKWRYVFINAVIPIIARALTMESKVMIADEPTSMLDPSSKANVIRMLKGV